MNKMIVRNVLIDIDGTLTYERNNYVRAGIPGGHNYFNMILVEMLAKKLGLTFHHALEMVLKAEEPCGRQDPFYAIESNPDWGITENTFWRRCVYWQRNHLFFYRDGIYMISELKKRGFNLIITSNNGSKAILLKLTRAGFATRNGSQYFSSLFGDDLTGCQKNNPNYFTQVINLTGITPEESVIVGDNLEQDFCTPRSAGFKKIIIVNRKLKKKLMMMQEVIFVNNLRTVVEILES